MALQIPKIGLPQMLKSGYQHHQGLEEAVFRNIAATKELSEMTRTCLGPHGRSKIVVNHLEKMFVTSDASTIMRELDVAHPAAKLVVFAAQQQQEMGDGANLVVVLCGALLAQADALLRMGLHPADLIRGFDVALKLTLKIMPNLAIDTLTEFSLKSLTRIVRPTIAAKQYGYEDILTKLVVEASLETISKNNNFNVDSIRVVKILGASIHDSTVVKGMVFGREPESTLQKATNAKVAIFTSGIDVALTETKGTVLIKNANDMLNFSKGM
jgi:T-complex protein 1 subunit theta